jgi:DNA-binding NarL/FixJ family response regulator
MARSSKLGLWLLTDDLRGRRRGPGGGVARGQTGRHSAGSLIERAADVLRLMAEGMSDKGIAASLFVSTNTVGTHIRHIFSKLGLADGVADNRRVLACWSTCNAPGR